MAQYLGNGDKSKVQSQPGKIYAVSFFHGQTELSNAGALEYTKCLSAKIWRNNSWGFEDVKSNAFQLPEDIIYHRQQFQRKMQIFQDVLFCRYKERKEDTQDRWGEDGHEGRLFDEFTSIQWFMMIWLVVTSMIPWRTFYLIHYLVHLYALTDSTQCCISAIFILEVSIIIIIIQKRKINVIMDAFTCV